MRIIEQFLSLQGEGCDVGTPALFLRLAGCNVGCPWCDTKHSWDMKAGREEQVRVLAKIVKEMTPKRGICVITGGEPFLQDEHLRELIYQVNGSNFFGMDEVPTIQFRIETSASVSTPLAYNSLPHNVKLNISPKFHAKHLVPAYWLTNEVNEFRFAVEKDGEQTIHWFQQLLYDYPSIERKAAGKIYLSPIVKPTQSKEEAEAWQSEVREFCQNAGFRYSFQMHKVWNIA